MGRKVGACAEGSTTELLTLGDSSTPGMHARRAAAAGERQQHPADKSSAADERNRVVEQVGRGEREQGERGKPEIDRKHKQYHLNHQVKPRSVARW